ncbi:MAG: lytic murein transglycosylase [Candidatus Moraniibacteriota bacterium]
MRLKNTKILSALAFLLVLGGAFGYTAKPVVADEASAIQNDISDLQKKLKKAQEKKDTLARDLANINSTLSATQRTIAQTQIKIQQAELEIERKRDEIALLEAETNAKRFILSGLLQDIYAEQDIPLPKVILVSENFSEYLNRPEELLSVQEKITTILTDLEDSKSETEGEKANLEDLKQAHQDLLQGKVAEKQALAADQQETQSDLADQEKVVGRLNKELSELQGDLSKILGKSYNAKDIKEAVDFASKRTGVPKGFLMGVLKMETNLGANVGGCTYAQVEDGAQANYKKGKLSKTSWGTFQYRRTLFKKITDELGIDYRKQKVSCNPSGYRGTGGAMGVAQFMPDTWMGYKSAVTAATGHNPPSPWNLTDGVMAMALKLDKVPGVDEGNRSAWKKAAALYLGTSYAPYINGILYWADNYKKLL